MKKLLSTLCATALAAAVGVTGLVPASAAPTYVPKVQTAQQGDVIQVQDRVPWRLRRGRDGIRVWEGNRRSRGDYRRYNRRNWDGDRYGWYNGHRGYRYKRDGYRYYNGWWFPAGAFIAGAIVGGAIANSNTYYNGYGGGSAHVQWCYDHYRSYRAYDNTFQPYNGPRRQCYSPYS